MFLIGLSWRHPNYNTTNLPNKKSFKQTGEKYLLIAPLTISFMGTWNGVLTVFKEFSEVQSTCWLIGLQSGVQIIPNQLTESKKWDLTGTVHENNTKRTSCL